MFYFHIIIAKITRNMLRKLCVEYIGIYEVYYRDEDLDERYPSYWGVSESIP